MKRILIVEDEMLIASALKKHIENAEYHCTGIAIDYNQAIAFLKQKDVDFVFLDITISGQKTGIDIAHYINFTNGLPFIFLTSHSDTNTLEELTKTKPVGYLSKPFKAVDITTALNLYFKNRKELKPTFKLTIGNNIYYVDLSNIQYAETNHVYVNLILEKETIMLRTSLTNLLQHLPKGILIRINRSIALNPNCIISIHNRRVITKDKTFKLSSNYANQFKDLL